MSEFSCLHENERYAACDDESYTVTSRTFVCQMGRCPLWKPPQQTGAMHPAGSIAPFVVSSPFHGLRVVPCKLT